MQFIIDGTLIGQNTEPYIIAEAGINHNGNLKQALEMIEIAKDAGASAVKFQTYKATELCSDEGQQFTYRSQGKEVTESMLEMFQRYEFKNSDWVEIKKYSEKLGITFFSTPQNLNDLNILMTIGVPAVKIGSDDLVNLPLIRGYADKNLPLILSSGMADLSEVHEALTAAGWYEGKQVAMLVCTSQYPTPSNDVNILRVQTLLNAFPGLIVGFSDHTQGDVASISAFAFGARIFEKHFTLSHDLPGPDHWFSLNPSELKSWVLSIKTAKTMLGDGLVRPTQVELEMRTIARRSIVALEDISVGQIITIQNVGVRRPGNGLSAETLAILEGRISKKDIKKGALITWSDI